MKHLLLPCITLLLMLSTVSQAVGQDTYEILRIYNANSITIGNRQKKVGDRFKLNEHIDFANERQSFYAQKLGTSKTYYFSKETMKAKKAKSLKDYFTNNYHKVKGSTRGESGNFPEISQGEHNIANYPEKRIALVIGNGNYNDLEILPNALNDARDVSDRLKQLGFDVVTLYDADINDMQTTVTSFFHLAQSYQVALIYFAGHGLRYEGKDYLLAIDRADLSIKDECSLDYLIEESEKWKSNGKVMIFVIDACRNQAGFANADDNRAIEAKKGTAILQSTSSGQVAIDSDAGSSNSPFAKAFINVIGQSGNDIEEEFSEIRREVRQKTSDRQVPRTSLGGGYNFYFCNGCSSHLRNSKKPSQNPTNLPIQSPTNRYNRPHYTDNQTHTNTTTSTQNTYTANELEEFVRKAEEQRKIRNYEEEVRLLKIAAEGGNSEAQTRLGYCYEKGEGTPQSYSQAEKMYRLAAEKGFAKAQYNLGCLYFYGRGVIQSYPVAVKWFQLAAEQGLDWAQNNLGSCYRSGHGVTKSCSEALKWYRMAANQGNYMAQCNLGELYAEGICISKSYIEAIKWFRLSAAQNFHGAQYNLGVCYENGWGVTKSFTEAVKWYRLAADQGNEKAQEKLSGL